MYYRQQQPETSVYPFPGFPSFPGYPGGGNIERRLDQIERVLERHTVRINRLNRRLQRIERQLGYGYDTDFGSF